MANTASETAAPLPFPGGDANPGSRRARQIKNAQFEQLRLERDALQVRLDAIEAAKLDVDEQGGTLNAQRMRKVLGQHPELDKGPLEKTLRDWLARTPKDFISTLEDRARTERGDAELREQVKALQAEITQLRGNDAIERDMGTDRAEEVIDRILAEFAETRKETCPKCGHIFKPKN